MPPETYLYILVASGAGGFAGALVMWNRGRSQVAGENRLRRLAVLAAGTAAAACALLAFAKAFRDYPHIYAAMLMILITAWAAVVQSVVQLPLPGFILRVRASEFAILRGSWTGVRLFGALLRNTPLRHLGGRVFLSDVGRDPPALLRGIHYDEAVHMWALLFCCPWLVFGGCKGNGRGLLVALRSTSRSISIQSCTCVM